jgi:agmatine deiminase
MSTQRISRRTFVRASGAVAATAAFGSAFPTPNRTDQRVTPASQGWQMPAEWAKHSRCWMAWPARKDIWEIYGKPLEGVRRDIAAVARAISQFEPVVIAVRPDQRSEAQRLCGADIGFFEVPVDDLWMRDTGPSFLLNSRGGLAGSSWNYNGWGNKPEAGKTHEGDSNVAGEILRHLGVPQFRAPIVCEGGALEVDGDGTLICTETSILNSNRNPGMSKEEATEVLQGWLGVQKVIWLADASPDTGTDGHIDGYLKFVRPGVVLFELSADPHEPDYNNVLEMLKSVERQTDARGRKLEVIKLFRPTKYASVNNPSFCNNYVNFYLANGGVVAPKYGDRKGDERAYSTLAQAYPDRKVVQLRVDMLNSGGGSIHCATQQEPLAS